ncbi:hypothetical protein B0H14DRAFT_3442139 [Mycena olivaceomarginata]|nr:hypothetical protein B0H14DRAFT_3442139 [Mycena olivaceomarginata]
MSATRPGEYRGGTCRLVSGPPRPVCCEGAIASPDRRLSSLDEFRDTLTYSRPPPSASYVDADGAYDKHNKTSIHGA